jgi:hypothetical protein
MPRHRPQNQVWVTLSIVLLVFSASAHAKKRIQTAPHGRYRDWFVYEVRKGESLYSIAGRLYGNSGLWRLMAIWNGIKPPYQLYPGEQLALHRPPRDKTQPQTPAKHPVAEATAVPPSLPAPSPSPSPSPEPSPSPTVAFSKVLEEAKQEGTVPEEPAPAESGAVSLAEARKQLKEGRCEPAALDTLHKSRVDDADALPGWFAELRCLRLLKREAEANALSTELLERRPELKDLPMFQGTSK